jgi:hypothetical protein
MGVTSATYSAADVAEAIAVDTNPTPLPQISTKEKTTAAGTNYQAVRHVQIADMQAAQAVLSYVASMNAPVYPMGNWAAAQLRNIMNGIGYGVVKPITTPTPAMKAAIATKVAEAEGKQSSSSTPPAAGSAGSSAAAGCAPNAWQNNVYGKNPAIIQDINNASKITGVPAAEIAAVMHNESQGGAPGWNGSAVGQPAGTTAYGDMQINAGTANQMLSSLPPGSIPNQGSASGAALSQSSQSANILLGAQYIKYVAQQEQTNGTSPTFSQVAYGYNQGAGAGKAFVAGGGQNGTAQGNTYASNASAALGCPGMTVPSGGGSASASQRTWGFNPIAPTAGGPLISTNELLYVLDMQRFSNPAWWNGISTATSRTFLAQQVAEIQATLQMVHEHQLMLKEYTASMIAMKNALDVQKVTYGVGNALRNRAIKQAVQG